MEWADIIRSTLALFFVLGLMGGVTLLLRRFGGGQLLAMKTIQKHLAIEEVRTVDAHHRLVLVRRDDVGHLLLLGQHGAVVVESGISLPAQEVETLSAKSKDIRDA